MASDIRVGLRTKDLSDSRLRYIAQLGIEDIFIDLRTPENNEKLIAANSQESIDVDGLTIRNDRVPTVDELEKTKQRLADFGLRFAGVHTLRPAMYKEIAFGTDRSAEQIENIKSLIRRLGEANIDVLGYQWMPDSVQRTTPEYSVRGEAKATAFDLDKYSETVEVDYTEETFWENYERFLDKVIPVAEDAGVMLAIHPADPPVVEKLNGIPRLFRDVESFERALEYYPSSSNSLKLCLGCFSEMGEDVPEVIRRFGDSISFVHFRDVVGTMPSFTETFIDDPQSNFSEVEAIEALRDTGFQGTILPDHVPRMENDTEWGHRSRGYTVGYLKGLIQATS